MQNARHYDFMVRKLRAFFHKKGFLEIPASSRLSIMAACEDPKTVTTFQMGGKTWPASQTGQMWLEMELLKNPDLPGVFCLGPSFRNEPNPIPGRHQWIFPMFDFEGRGDFEELKKIEAEILQEFGFAAPTPVQYEELCKAYGAETIEAEQESKVCAEVSATISLEKFPTRANPFWNMRYIGDGLFNKIDVLTYGMETIGSAERSCNPEEMYTFFLANSDGKYAELLFKLFGKDRVMKELDEYLSLDFFPRFGGGIGLTRLENACKQAGLFDQMDSYTSPYTFMPYKVEQTTV